MGSRERANALIVEGLANGWTDARVAESAGVGPKTVQRRRADPEILAQVRALVEERQRERNRRLVEVWDAGEKVTGQALLTLVELLNSRSEIARLQAARTILERFGPTERPADVAAPDLVRRPERLRDLFAVDGQVSDQEVILAARRQLLGVEPAVEAPRLRVVEENGAPARPGDGLTDEERHLLVKRGLYREGVSAAIQRATLKRAGYG
jgi:hypothetical protein